MKQILVIEDDQSIAKPLVNLLQLRGYKPIWEDNAVDALCRIEEKENNFKCLLVDVMLPKMSGWEFREKLQERELLCDTNMIFLSADPDSQKKATELGETFVSKPIDLQLLINSIEKVLASEDCKKAAQSSPENSIDKQRFRHDIRSCLTAIHLGIRYLKELPDVKNCLEEEALKTVDQIEVKSKESIHLIDQWKDLHDSEANKI